jgi:SET domain
MVQIRSDSPRGERTTADKAHRTSTTTLAAAAAASRSGLRWTTALLVLVTVMAGAVYHLTAATATAVTASKDARAFVSTTSSQQLRGSDNECRFYLGESAIPGSGLGLFTAIDLQPGQEAQSMADICLYVADTPRRTHFETHSWARDVFLGTFEGESPRGACEGFATLFNSMPPGVQTSKLDLHQTHDNGGLRRDRDAGAGAMTHYYGISSVATRHVAAASELTIDYGDFTYKEGKKYTAPVRTVPWLREHGMCIDHIRIQTATDPSMGRGAFAVRRLKKGTIVAPAPLQLFPNRAAFAEVAVGPEPLFLNYCYSVGDTEMLLYPYGPGVGLINHASPRKGKRKPNVELQWSTHSMNHATWLDLPLSQLRQMDYPGGLILDVVALRNIQPGEELYMDYGEAWETAWDEHVQAWSPDPSASSYVYPQDMDMTQPFRTVEEQQSNPYPSNLATVCWTPNWDRDKDTKMAWTKPTYDWPEGITYCNIQQRTKLVDKKDGALVQYEYEVSLNFEAMEPDRKDKLEYIDTRVPHNAIWFVDKPYESDMHLRNAFRHPIALPAQIVPPAWLLPDTMTMEKKSERKTSNKDRARRNDRLVK